MTEQSTFVLAPCSGALVPLSEVPDPVFAAHTVGGGVAIDPPHERLEVRAPISGLLLKVHPHAFVVLHPGGRGVLVHLGIDTMKLGGAGFTVLGLEDYPVHAGQPVIEWDVTVTVQKGLSPVVPVVVMDSAVDEVAPCGRDRAIVAEMDPLYLLPST